MSRFGNRDALPPGEVEDTYDPAVDCHCHLCGRQFNGSDASGGHCMTCCKSFRSLGGFDKHRTGKYEPNTRRCLTTEELQAKGWTVDESNCWRMPAPKTNPWRKQ